MFPHCFINNFLKKKIEKLETKVAGLENKIERLESKLQRQRLKYEELEENYEHSLHTLSTLGLTVSYCYVSLA